MFSVNVIYVFISETHIVLFLLLEVRMWINEVYKEQRKMKLFYCLHGELKQKQTAEYDTSLVSDHPQAIVYL